MKQVKICIGSACHLRGSEVVIEIFQELIKTNHLEAQLELCGAFCTGHCTEAVAVVRWDGKFLSVNEENASLIFKQEIMSQL